ncbi:MAG: hypothetical protein K0M55_19110 [Rhizobium sp.]|nr:hypothetical protein [Rhizobium sp.]
MYGSAIAASAGVPFAFLASSAGAQTELILWYYGAGKAEERRIMARATRKLYRRKDR